MPRTIFITEGASPLGAALIRLFIGRGYAVATTRESAAEGAVPAAEARSILTVPWRRRSPVSARTALLTAVNALDAVDEALLLEPSLARARLSSAPFPETASADIERAFDEAKGPVFMAREILSLFRQSGRGVLCMVSGGAAAGALEAGVRECFRGVAVSLMAESGAAGIVVNGFQSDGAGAEEYAAFIDRTLEEKARAISGRWFTCPSRGGFLQGMRFRTSSIP